MNALQYLILSFRSWLKTPFVFILAIFMIAVGIGASVAAYGFLHAALLQPLTVKRPHEIMRVLPTTGGGGMSAGDYYDLAGYSSTLADSVLTRPHYGINFQVGDTAILVTAGEVSGNYFNVLDVPAIVGRTLEREDDVAGADPVVVVSERFWRNELDGREDLPGALVQLNGRPATVIGIVPESFRGTFRRNNIDVWFPHQQTFEAWQIHVRGFHAWAVLFRLKEEMSATQVQGELNAFAAHLGREFPDTRAEYSLQLRPEREVELERHQTLATQSYFILGILLTLLLIACANVSNILLGKVNARRSELAVRRALGAPRSSIFGLVMADGLVLAGIAGIASIFFAFLFVKGFSLLGMETAPGEALNRRVLLFFLGVTLAVGLLCSFIPAIQAIRVNINQVLKESSRSSTRFRTGQALIVLQVAFSLALLIAGGLFIRSLQEVQRVELGIRTENILSFGLNLGNLGGYSLEDRIPFYRRLIEALEESPDVVSAGISTHRLLRGAGWGGVWASDVDFPDGSPLWRTNYFVLGPGFFETMDVPIVKGRATTMEDIEKQEKVAVINETLASRFWPGQNPIGREFHPWGRSDPLKLRVVGVCRDFRIAVREPPPALFMYPQAVNQSVVKIHTRMAPETMKPRILGIMRELEPALPLHELQTIDESVEGSIQSIRAGLTIMTIVGLLGLAISVIGIYTALSYWVRRSSEEIGLRIALGASPAVIVGMYVRRGASIVLGGLLLGLGLAAFAMPYAEDLLYEIAPRDPVTLVAVPIILFLTALLASYFSARHAAGVDPMVALRRE